MPDQTESAHPGDAENSQASASPAKKPSGRQQFKAGRGALIPESVRLTVRSFYVVQGLSPAVIAPMVGMVPQQVSNLVAREKWKRLRDEKRNQREQKSNALQDARAAADVSRVVEAVAIRAEELSVRSLDYCGELLDAKDAKSLQMASGAARNFVQIARASRGLDQKPGNFSGGDRGPSVLVFVGELERVERPARNVSPNADALEVRAIECAETPKLI